MPAPPPPYFAACSLSSVSADETDDAEARRSIRERRGACEPGGLASVLRGEEGDPRLTNAEGTGWEGEGVWMEAGSEVWGELIKLSLEAAWISVSHPRVPYLHLAGWCAGLGAFS